MFDIHGKLLKQFTLLDNGSTNHIVECHLWGNGVAAMTSDTLIFVAEVLKRLKTTPFSSPCLAGALVTGRAGEGAAHLLIADGSGR